MGTLWGSCFASRFPVVPGVARNGGAASAAGAVCGVKCLVGAVSFCRNGGDCGACLGCGPMAWFAAVTCAREPAGYGFKSYRVSIRTLLMNSWYVVGGESLEVQVPWNPRDVLAPGAIAAL